MKFRLRLQSRIQGLINLCFPERCRHCLCLLNDREGGLCSSCHASIQYISSPVCRLCGCELPRDWDREHLCGQCILHPPSYTTARSLVSYTSPVSDLLRRLKYNGDTTVLPALEGVAKASTVPESLSANRYIVPVPLHRLRLQHRGLNQSVLLARILFPDQLEKICPDLLRRIRNTLPQTGLDGVSRRKNLRGAFAVDRRYRLEGRSVLLVDDIFTTGSTVDECSRILLSEGASEVHVLTFARVSTKGVR